jgi:SAM-dependent methyltransferase
MARMFVVNEHQAAQHFVLAEGDGARHDMLARHIRSLWNESSCEVLECAACQLGFASPFVAGDGEFYNLAYPHSDYPKAKWEFSTTVTALEKLNRGNGHILEIGSGFGYFLDHVCPRFFDRSDVVAVEYNDVASQRLRDQGYMVVQQDVRTAGFDRFEHAFDSIFMFQVLEHMDKLDELAKRLHFLTSNRANLFIAVPNPIRIRFNEQHGSLLDMPPNHISRWNRRSLTAFAARAGFEMVEFQEEPMAWTAFAKQDLVYSYMRRSQRPGSLENRLRSQGRSGIRRIQEAALALAGGPSRLPAWVAAATSNGRLGGSIWAHLRRK